LERVIDEKLTHMLSIQKCPIDKIGLRYVASISDIPSTSKTVFVKPTVLEPLLAYVDKGKVIMEGEVPAITKPPQKPPAKKEPPVTFDPGVLNIKVGRSYQDTLHQGLNLPYAITVE
jgi:hypothetical protein